MAIVYCCHCTEIQQNAMPLVPNPGSHRSCLFMVAKRAPTFSDITDIRKALLGCLTSMGSTFNLTDPLKGCLAHTHYFTSS